ncbi:pollen-specific leucine-rich repeat extensin-like protein 2 isoform X1 [Morone saxatilis]|uniref:pollen-specific leucine-rich repeat extensin-like protein 2 isoform X1 n=1 Tax=Morone saxatilis TaxID=34816 RepID=UPI0015E20686|nr:pollen-specific leucine-rich repeat extensin-like protein 2 isoform X1 [Morone saxatilis]
MAFSSRFSFWEQKIKEENKPGSKSPDSDGQPSRAKSVPALDPGRGLFRAKSPPPVFPTESAARVRSPSPPKVRTPVKVPERFKSPEPPSKSAEQFRIPERPQAALSPEPVMNSVQEQNGVMGKSMVNGTAKGNIKNPGTSNNHMDTTDDQGLTRKKVVKVVRRVVRKVLSTEEDEVAVPTQPSDKAPEAAKPAAEPVKTVPAPSVSKTPAVSGFSFKHDVIKTEEKDDISRGLTNFMVRGRTREPRPRIRKDERPEKMELEKKNEKKEEKVEPEEKREDKTILKPQEVNHKPTSSGPVIQEIKSPVVAVNATSMASECSASASSKSTHSRPTSLPPVVGFIPGPKPVPLSPPPGFIPAPKPAAAAKPTPAKPPSTTSVAQKSSSLSPPLRLFPAPKSSPLATSVSPAPPHPNPGAVSPPPGVIPIQQPAVSQQELEPAVSVPSSVQAPAPAAPQPQDCLQVPQPSSLPLSLLAGICTRVACRSVRPGILLTFPPFPFSAVFPTFVLSCD